MGKNNSLSKKDKNPPKLPIVMSELRLVTFGQTYPQHLQINIAYYGPPSISIVVYKDKKHLVISGLDKTMCGKPDKKFQPAVACLDYKPCPQCVEKFLLISDLK